MKKFLKYQEEIANLQYTINLLLWELRVVAPKDSETDLINLISYHEKRLFNLQTSIEYYNLLNGVINSQEYKNLSIEEQRYIQNLLKRYQKNKNVPIDFYEEYSKVKAVANVMWRKAKNANDYKIYEPYLDKIIKLTKTYYEYMYPGASNIYDAMLSDYEYGVDSKLLDKLFSKLKEGIIKLIPNNEIKVEEPYFEYTNQQLNECANYLLNYIGFDLNKGTLGIYPHGYTEKMSKNDIRIAFSYTNNPIDFVTTIIHEGGHALFEQNISPNLAKYENVTVENLCALHENQSRFYENFLGRNKNFWIPIYDDIKNILNLNYTLDEFVSLLNTPKCNPIRTSADELTYCMHIILRYEIERDIFNGKIKVSELPEIWNQKTKEYLNIEVQNDSEGLMQDVHWSEGDFGYFPSYLLGSIYDGMFFEAIQKQLGSVDELLKNGKIKEITDFLIKKIYINGGAYTSLEIINKLCGKEISVKPLINYFNNKYSKN